MIKILKIVKIVDSFNLLHVTGLFLQPHKTEKKQIFWCFQRIQEKASDIKRVKSLTIAAKTRIINIWQGPKYACDNYFTNYSKK